MSHADLIARLEKLEGPDCEVDTAIMEIADPSFVGSLLRHADPFTASLDAAVALVERVLRPLHPCMTVNLRGFFDTASHPGWWRAEITWPSYERVGHAPSPAIALLIAALKALQEKHNER